MIGRLEGGVGRKEGKKKTNEERKERMALENRNYVNVSSKSILLRLSM